MNPHEKAAEAVWVDTQDWLIAKHQKEIENFYSRLFGEYLTEKFGKLSPDARKHMIRTFMKKVIDS